MNPTFSPILEGWRQLKHALPVEGVEVMTIIHDENGTRNEGSLIRRGNLWFFPDMSMYVYYTPTHWRYMEGHS